ncbi:MAG: potassium transporter TrkG [Wolbachia sp.]
MHGIPVIFAITSCAWIALSLFAAIPFYLDSLDYVDVLFETTSCFTTTVATVFSDVEKLSPGILLWGAILHGIGGFGIIVSATLTNSGPGFSNLIGPSGNCSSFSSGVKLFLSFLMMLGRLEILPIYFCIGNLLLFNRRE